MRLAHPLLSLPGNSDCNITYALPAHGHQRCFYVGLSAQVKQVL